MNTYRCDKDILQNLKDAGCDEATIQAFMDCLHSGKQVMGTNLLERHRRSLINNLHAWQKRIDCLDYLLFVMRKQNHK